MTTTPEAATAVVAGAASDAVQAAAAQETPGAEATAAGAEATAAGAAATAAGAAATAAGAEATVAGAGATAAGPVPHSVDCSTSATMAAAEASPTEAASRGGKEKHDLVGVRSCWWCSRATSLVLVQLRGTSMFMRVSLWREHVFGGFVCIFVFVQSSRRFVWRWLQPRSSTLRTSARGPLPVPAARAAAERMSTGGRAAAAGGLRCVPFVFLSVTFLKRTLFCSKAGARKLSNNCCSLPLCCHRSWCRVSSGCLQRHCGGVHLLVVTAASQPHPDKFLASHFLRGTCRKYILISGETNIVCVLLLAVLGGRLAHAAGRPVSARPRGVATSAAEAAANSGASSSSCGAAAAACALAVPGGTRAGATAPQPRAAATSACGSSPPSSFYAAHAAVTSRAAAVRPAAAGGARITPATVPAAGVLTAAAAAAAAVSAQRHAVCSAGAVAGAWTWLLGDDVIFTFREESCSVDADAGAVLIRACAARVLAAAAVAVHPPRSARAAAAAAPVGTAAQLRAWTALLQSVLSFPLLLFPLETASPLLAFLPGYFLRVSTAVAAACGKSAAGAAAPFLVHLATCGAAARHHAATPAQTTTGSQKTSSGEQRIHACHFGYCCYRCCSVGSRDAASHLHRGSTSRVVAVQATLQQQQEEKQEQPQQQQQEQRPQQTEHRGHTEGQDPSRSVQRRASVSSRFTTSVGAALLRASAAAAVLQSKRSSSPPRDTGSCHPLAILLISAAAAIAAVAAAAADLSLVAATALVCAEATLLAAAAALLLASCCLHSRCKAICSLSSHRHARSSLHTKSTCSSSADNTCRCSISRRHTCSGHISCNSIRRSHSSSSAPRRNIATACSGSTGNSTWSVSKRRGDGRRRSIASWGSSKSNSASGSSRSGVRSSNNGYNHTLSRPECEEGSPGRSSKSDSKDNSSGSTSERQRCSRTCHRPWGRGRSCPSTRHCTRLRLLASQQRQQSVALAVRCDILHRVSVLPGAAGTGEDCGTAGAGEAGLARVAETPCPAAACAGSRGGCMPEKTAWCPSAAPDACSTAVAATGDPAAEPARAAQTLAAASAGICRAAAAENAGLRLGRDAAATGEKEPAAVAEVAAFPRDGDVLAQQRLSDSQRWLQQHWPRGQRGKEEEEQQEEEKGQLPQQQRGVAQAVEAADAQQHARSAREHQQRDAVWRQPQQPHYHHLAEQQQQCHAVVERSLVPQQQEQQTQQQQGVALQREQQGEGNEEEEEKQKQQQTAKQATKQRRALCLPFVRERRRGVSGGGVRSRLRLLLPLALLCLLPACVTGVSFHRAVQGGPASRASGTGSSSFTCGQLAFLPHPATPRAATAARRAAAVAASAGSARSAASTEAARQVAAATAPAAAAAGVPSAAGATLGARLPAGAGGSLTESLTRANAASREATGGAAAVPLRLQQQSVSSSGRYREDATTAPEMESFLRPLQPRRSLFEALQKGPLRVSVVGSGNWGSVIGKIVASNAARSYIFHDTVRIWVYEEQYEGMKLTEWINKKHENPKYLPNVPLPANLVATPDMVAACDGADLLVFVLPHQFLEAACDELAKANVLPGHARAISLLKGLHIDCGRPQLFSDVITKKLDISGCAALCGANVAKDVAQEEFAEATLGYTRGEEDTALIWQQLFDTPYFKINALPDVAGVQVCGAVKNVIALAAGFCDGLRLGTNTKSAIIRIGVEEMRQFAGLFFDNVLTVVFVESSMVPTALQSGVRDDLHWERARAFYSRTQETFFDSAGYADVITTIFGGRNARCAAEFVRAQGKKSWAEIETELLHGQKLQGTLTTKEVYDVLASHAVEHLFPLFRVTYEIAFKQRPPSDVVGVFKSTQLRLHRSLKECTSVVLPPLMATVKQRIARLQAIVDHERYRDEERKIAAEFESRHTQLGKREEQ